ncbi:unknown [Sutterella sp. CAG:397]|nr:unknown [Sutterella sp. CAG:397]
MTSSIRSVIVPELFAVVTPFWAFRTSRLVMRSAAFGDTARPKARLFAQVCQVVAITLASMPFTRWVIVVIRFV